MEELENDKQETKETKEDILKRLRRIEGQVKGIQRMIEEEKSCRDILTQVSAVRVAINKVGNLILKNHSMSCIENVFTSPDEKEKTISELSKTLQSFMRFTE